MPLPLSAGCGPGLKSESRIWDQHLFPLSPIGSRKYRPYLRRAPVKTDSSCWNRRRRNLANVVGWGANRNRRRHRPGAGASDSRDRGVPRLASAKQAWSQREGNEFEPWRYPERRCIVRECIATFTKRVVQKRRWWLCRTGAQQLN